MSSSSISTYAVQVNKSFDGFVGLIDRFSSNFSDVLRLLDEVVRALEYFYIVETRTPFETGLLILEAIASGYRNVSEIKRYVLERKPDITENTVKKLIWYHYYCTRLIERVARGQYELTYAGKLVYNTVKVLREEDSVQQYFEELMELLNIDFLRRVVDKLDSSFKEKLVYLKKIVSSLFIKKVEYGSRSWSHSDLINIRKTIEELRKIKREFERIFERIDELRGRLAEWIGGLMESVSIAYERRVGKSGRSEPWFYELVVLAEKSLRSGHNIFELGDLVDFGCNESNLKALARLGIAYEKKIDRMLFYGIKTDFLLDVIYAYQELYGYVPADWKVDSIMYRNKLHKRWSRR